MNQSPLNDCIYHLGMKPPKYDLFMGTVHIQVTTMSFETTRREDFECSYPKELIHNIQCINHTVPPQDDMIIICPLKYKKTRFNFLI
jgi:hypothetical protein